MVQLLGAVSTKDQVVKILKTERGKPLLITSLHYRFRQQGQNADGTKLYWVCLKSGSCPARMHTDANYNFLKAVNSHTHVGLAQDTAAVEAKGKIKDMAKAGQFSGKPSLSQVKCRVLWLTKQNLPCQWWRACRGTFTTGRKVIGQIFPRQ